MELRPLQPHELDPLLALAAQTGLFGPDELVWLREQVEVWTRGELAHAQLCWAVACERDQLLGACHVGLDGAYEPAHLPDVPGVWNLYFVGVAPEARGRGLGAALLDYAERYARERGGQQMIIETSFGPAFTPAHGLYASRGYVEHGRVADAYGPGQDKLILLGALG